METSLGYQIINSYKRLPYTAWYALAEFVDNSTQAYFNNENVLKKQLEKDNENLTVSIFYDGKSITITDNSMGMNESELSHALKIGDPPKIKTGRSKYGLGLKTAACWFGDRWSIKTKRLTDDYEHSIVFNVKEVAKSNLNVHHTQKRINKKNAHYTIIKIEALHNKLYTNTIRKIKDYLSSIYRLDFANYGLDLYFQNELLDWKRFEPKLYFDEKENGFIRREFKFRIDKKKSVKGWVGILDKGSRAKAGFSLIQAGRVIIGWPQSFRPKCLFGNQPGGSNDLANQRIVGEMHLNGFEVSHTKNAIMWENNDEEKLEKKLQQHIGDFRDKANDLRRTDDEQLDPKIIHDSVIEMTEELNSKEFKDTFNDLTEINEELLQESNKILIRKVINEKNPDIKVNIGAQKLKLYVNSDMSPNDPYIISQIQNNNNELIIIINRNHPHWEELSTYESVLNYLRHCSYDGISEWKAKFLTKKIKPDTIKWIKDRFLRLSFELANN